MVRTSKASRPLRIWWAGPLALIVCMGAGGQGVRAEERMVPSLAIREVTGGSPAPISSPGPG